MNKKFTDIDIFINDLLSRIECDECDDCPAKIRVKTLDGDYRLDEYLKKYIKLKD